MKEKNKKALVDCFYKLCTISHELEVIAKQERIEDSKVFYHLDIGINSIVCGTEDLGQGLEKDLDLEIDWSKF